MMKANVEVVVLNDDVVTTSVGCKDGNIITPPDRD